MKNWFWLWGCAVLGAVVLICGLLVPVHLRAVDSAVIAAAGRGTPTVIQKGLDLGREGHSGAARMLLQAARLELLPDREELRDPASQPAREHPASLAVAGEDAVSGRPVTEVALRLENRDQILDQLRASRDVAVQALLRFREATNTVIFPASSSASGQALDAAIGVTGLLLDGKCLTASLNTGLTTFAAQANANDSAPLEESLMDFLSLGERMTWDQLTVFVKGINNPETLRSLADAARADTNRVPVLFAAVVLSGDPGGVARYVETFSQSGLSDLGLCLRAGQGGVDELLQRNVRLHRSETLERMAGLPVLGMISRGAANLALRSPRAAEALRWTCFFAAGLLFALALHLARAPVSELERPLQVRGFHLARETLFALGFLLVVLLLSEPFLAQESQKADFHFRWRLPVVGSAVPAGTPANKPPFMNPTNLLTLLLFFVLQALLYSASLVKLAEIRRQRVPARTKLKLLENEEHLFDAGLYLGFGGTIVSLILVSLGVIQFSLMAAYSSTSFGILFVFIFKICNLRPVRRRLLLEAEGAMARETTATSAEPALATMP